MMDILISIYLFFDKAKVKSQFENTLQIAIRIFPNQQGTQT